MRDVTSTLSGVDETSYSPPVNMCDDDVVSLFTITKSQIYHLLPNSRFSSKLGHDRDQPQNSCMSNACIWRAISVGLQRFIYNGNTKIHVICWHRLKPNKLTAPCEILEMLISTPGGRAGNQKLLINLYSKSNTWRDQSSRNYLSLVKVNTVVADSIIY